MKGWTMRTPTTAQPLQQNSSILVTAAAPRWPSPTTVPRWTRRDTPPEWALSTVPPTTFLQLEWHSSLAEACSSSTLSGRVLAQKLQVSPVVALKAPQQRKASSRRGTTARVSEQFHEDSCQRKSMQQWRESICWWKKTRSAECPFARRAIGGAAIIVRLANWRNIADFDKYRPQRFIGVHCCSL